MTARRTRRPAAPAAGFDMQAFRAALADIIAEAGPDDRSPKVEAARKILRDTCASCGGDLDDFGRDDPAHLCPACRTARPLVA